MEFYTPPTETADEGITLQDVWLLALRWIVAIPLVAFQGWEQIQRAWGFVWNKAEWPLIDRLEALSMPVPNVIGPALALLLVLVPLALIIGFVTRINALLGLLTCGFILVTALEVSETLSAQALVLHCGILIILLCAGGGRLGLDGLLRRPKDAVA